MNIDAESQGVVDNMTAGYIKLMTDVDTEVIEPGRVKLNRKFGKTGNIQIDTASNPDGLIVCITDDDDHDLYVEELFEGLDGISDRVNEIIQMEENGEL